MQGRRSDCHDRNSDLGGPLARWTLFSSCDERCSKSGHSAMVGCTCWPWTGKLHSTPLTQMHCCWAFAVFGFTDHVLETIAAIYQYRTFQLHDCGQHSSARPQNSGISQGCPLSPSLFVMMMSVLMADAAKQLNAGDQELWPKGVLAELLYADDTLLLGVSASRLQRFLVAVSEGGGKYGIELHPGKLQLMQIRCDDTVRRPGRIWCTWARLFRITVGLEGSFRNGLVRLGVPRSSGRVAPHVAWKSEENSNIQCDRRAEADA